MPALLLMVLLSSLNLLGNSSFTDFAVPLIVIMPWFCRDKPRIDIIPRLLFASVKRFVSLTVTYLRFCVNVVVVPEPEDEDV